MEFTLDSPGVMVSRLHQGHLDGIIELMNNEGWYYYDHHELQRYLNLDQECFTLLTDGRITGSIFTTHYGNQAWIGNIVIAQEARGKGLAYKLIKAVIDHLRSHKQVHTFRLASVPLAIGLYKKVGFHAEAFTTAQEAELPITTPDEPIQPGNNLRIEALAASDLETISKIDAQYFKSDRLQFLKNIYNDSMKESCFCLKDQKRIVGFLMVRRRRTSKQSGNFSGGPEYVYRLGPSCILPEYGVKGFKSLFEKAIKGVNKEARQHQGSSRIYAVFPRNADKVDIYKDTRHLARVMGMDAEMNLDGVFDEHDLLFGAPKSTKNQEQWNYMKSLGFHQEYFEQVMSYTPTERTHSDAAQKTLAETKADPEGLFASATPGDKA